MSNSPGEPSQFTPDTTTQTHMQIFPKVKTPRWKYFLPNCIGTAFWLFVIIKLFIFDIDNYLIHRFLPDHEWLLWWKFFLIISLLAFVWLFTDTRALMKWLLYVIGFPFLVLIWKIPIFIYGQQSWALAFAIINSLIGFFRSIKYTFITAAVVITASAVIMASEKKIFLWLSSALLLSSLLGIYVTRFLTAFRPNSIYRIYLKMLAGFRVKAGNVFTLEESIRNQPVSKLNETQLQTWMRGLTQSVLFNRVCLFVARKLRNYQSSSIHFLPYIVMVIFLTFLTITSFALLNLAQYKLDPGSFRFTDTPDLFTFIYYSFSTFVFNAIEELYPASIITKSLLMTEYMLAITWGVILVSLVASVKSQKSTAELNEVISGLEREGSEMEAFIMTEYRLESIGDAMAELERLKAGAAKFMYKMTESLK